MSWRFLVFSVFSFVTFWWLHLQQIAHHLIEVERDAERRTFRHQSNNGAWPGAVRGVGNGRATIDITSSGQAARR
jgi:hypothetical protein